MENQPTETNTASSTFPTSSADDENLVSQNESDGDKSSTLNGDINLASNDGEQTEDNDKSNQKMKTIPVETSISDKRLNKNNKKQKIKRKGAWKRRLMTFSIILLLGIMSGVFLADWYKKYLDSQKTDYTAYVVADYIEDYHPIISNALGKPEASDSEIQNFATTLSSSGKTPKDFTASENVIMAIYKSGLASSYTAIGRGKVIAMGIPQTIYSAKKYDGKNYTVESISLGILTVATCTKFDVNFGSISVVKGNNPTENNAEWTGDTTSYTTSEFDELTGGLPSDILPYIISSKTVLDEDKVEISETTLNEKPVFEFTIKLHSIFSVLLYQKQVKYTSGLSDSPTFNDVTIKFYLEADWDLVRTEISEHYSMIYYGVNASCEGTLDTDYTFNEPVTLPM